MDQSKEFKKYPLGFRLYLYLFLINTAIKILFIKQLNNNSILYFGLDSQTGDELVKVLGNGELTFMNIIARLVGLIISVFIVYQLYKLKNWARIVLTLLAIVTILSYVVRYEGLLKFFSIASGGVWVGLIFFILLLFYNLIMSFFVLIYFNRKSIKALFSKQ